MLLSESFDDLNNNSGVIRCVLYVTKYRILQIFTVITGKTLNTLSHFFFIIILLHISTLPIMYMLYFLLYCFLLMPLNNTCYI